MLAGVGLAVGGAVVWGVGVGVVASGYRGGYDDINAKFFGSLTSWLGSGLITAGVPVAMYGGLRNEPRNPALAIAGMPIAALGAGALTVGVSFLVLDQGQGKVPGAPLALAGLGATALGLTLYLFGARRAPAREAAKPALEVPWIRIGPTGAVAGIRF